MTNKEIRNFAAEINSLLDRRQLGNVYTALANMARSQGDYDMVDRISRAEQSYSYLLKYLVDGVDDPSRDKVYDDLFYEAGQIRDLLIRSALYPDTPTLYFNTLRSSNSHAGESLKSLFEAYRQQIAALSPFAKNNSDNSKIRLEAERLIRDIFNRLWVTFPIKNDEEQAIASFIADDSLPEYARATVVSALTLGLLEYFDRRRISLLADAYVSDNSLISIRALVGLSIALEKYKDMKFGSDLDNQLSALPETANWNEDVKQTFVELIRTVDTERIAGKMNDEIIPEIQKLGKEMADKLNEANFELDNLESAENPEWEDLIADEKIKNNLKELSQLQQEGADVFMSTFKGLKQFPFFNEAVNWFLPFDVEHSVVLQSSFDKSMHFAEIIDTAPFICDNDKYSMLLSLTMMPASQREIMTSQLKAQQDNIDSMMSLTDKSLRPFDRKAAINNYILTIYRFYMLFRRKGEFYNPFAKVANPVEVSAFTSVFDNEQSLATLGEFYLKVGLYEYARHILARLDGMSMPDASRYQKLGYCCEKLGDYESAVSYYEQADLLSADNNWNLRRLAAMYSKLDKTDDAISTYRRLERLLPEDIDIAYALGDLYLRQHNYERALEQYNKIEYFMQDDRKAIRRIARTLLLSGKLSDAQKYYDRLLKDSPSVDDFLNAAHLAWARKQLHLAISYYRQVADKTSLQTLIAYIREDSSLLANAGVDISLMPMIIDAIIYSFKKQ